MLTPGEGWGGGLTAERYHRNTPSLTLPRSTGGGNQVATTYRAAQGTTASASISIWASESISFATSTIVVAGRISAKTSP